VSRAKWLHSFTSTIERIITLSTLLQTRREFNKPLWIAYVDLKSAFDSVDTELLRLLLRRLSIPEKMVELLKELYSETHVAVYSLYWQMERHLSGSESSLEYDWVALFHQTSF